LGGLVIARVRAMFPDADVEAAVAVPAPALVDELFPFVRNAAAAGASLPFALRRVLALGHSQKGAMPEAAVVFEALLDEQGDDLPTLLAFARHLVHAARRGGPSAAALDQRRRDVLEAVFQHHAFALKPAVLLDVIAELCALRLAASDTPSAKKAAKKALALLTSHPELAPSLSDRAVRSFVLALDDNGVDEPDYDALEQALRLDVQRAVASSEKARLVEKQALVALAARNDVVVARQLLVLALQHDPELSSAREKLFDLELAGEDPRLVLERSRALLEHEKDPHKKAQLHLKLFHLQRKVRGHGVADDVAVDEIRAAFELDPTNAAVREAAEKFFGDRKDARGLDELLTSQLKTLDRNDIAGRTSLLERLARLRRYETRDLRGAIDACEAHSALLPDAIKPREDAARLHSELGQWREAVSAWRAVLERDPLAVEAWRGLLSVLARSRQADEAFAVAATMAAIDIADDDIVRAVRAVRPPFPRWPIAPADTNALKKRLAHPQERSAVRAVLEVVAPRLLPRLGRPLEDFGIRRRDALAEAKLPPSVVMGVRTASTLAGFRAPVPLYLAEPGTLDVSAPAFMALPAADPGLIVTADVVKGGMTPERAFALGRAITWLSPWALLSSSLDGVELRELIEGLVAGFLSSRDLERAGVEVERRGAALKAEILGGLSSTEADTLVQALLPALRDWVVSRQRLQLSEWKAGVGFSGDRLGLLLAGELPAALKVIRQTGSTNAATRAAIRELVLFSVSGPALQLRRELSLALQDQGLAPILDLG
jgi:tetratricopeptide (TPR) repeat protein